MRSLFLLKSQLNIWRIFALKAYYRVGQKSFNFWLAFRKKRWSHKFIVNFTDLYKVCMKKEKNYLLKMQLNICMSTISKITSSHCSTALVYGTVGRLELRKGHFLFFPLYHHTMKRQTFFQTKCVCIRILNWQSLFNEGFITIETFKLN